MVRMSSSLFPGGHFNPSGLTSIVRPEESKPMDTATLAKDAKPARRKPESLAKLKKAARKLFVERGYHATRPQDIARDAGLGHGTFYLHYEDKRACFLAFVEDAREELDSFIRSRQTSDASLEDA